MTAATYALAQMIRVLPRARINRAVGRLCDREVPSPILRAAIGAFQRAYDVDVAEATVPAGGYRSFDAFFTRELRRGTRPLPPDEWALVSPADGRLDVFGEVGRDTVIAVKGRPYRASELLGRDGTDGAEEAERYRGGTCALVYLSPRDYHRVHAPAAGDLVEVRSYPGDFLPVNSVSEAHFPRFLARNRRVAIVLETPHFGRLTVVMVAAMIVGRITVTGVDERDVPLRTIRPSRALPIERGGELGVFHLGSTAVIFVEPGRLQATDPTLGPILMGQALARSSAARPAEEGLRG